MCQLYKSILFFHVILGARGQSLKIKGVKIWYLWVHFLFGINSICCCEDIIQEYKNIAFQVKGKVRTGRENTKGWLFRNSQLGLQACLFYLALIKSTCDASNHLLFLWHISPLWLIPLLCLQTKQNQAIRWLQFNHEWLKTRATLTTFL